MKVTRGSKWAIGIWSFVALALATQFNACSQQVMFSQSLASLKNELLSSSVVLINGDAQFTNDQQVEVSLQNSLADEVYVTNDSTCDAGGTWQPMQDKKSWTLADVNKEVAVYARFRNTAEGIVTDCVSDSIVHDGEKPAILLNSPSIVTNVPVPIFNFLAWDAISGVKRSTCKWPGSVAVDCASASSNGNVPEGLYDVEVVAEDNAGNISDPTLQALVVDRTPPVVVLNSAPPAATANPNATFDFSANDNLSGIKSYECSQDNGATFAVCSSPVSWTVTEGPHKFQVRATDNAGNVSAVVSHDFVLDLTAPTVRILSGPNSFSNSPSATFTFDGMDDGMPITKFQCKVDSGAYSDCNSPKTYNGLADGQHTFYVVGLDSANLASSPASRTWTVDTAGPVVTFTQVPPAVTNTGSATFRYTIVDSGSGVVGAECSLDNGAFKACDLLTTSVSALPSGSHSMRVRGIDKAGNTGAPAVADWKIDVTAPVLTLVSGPDAFSNSPSATFKYTAQDPGGSGIARVDCRLDAAVYAPCDSVSQHTVDALAEGSRRVAIRAVDNAGNLSNELIVVWTVDLTGPKIDFFQQPVPIISSISKQTLGFTVEDSSSGVDSVVCKLNGVVKPCASGELLSYTNMAAGVYTFMVTAKDKAGNQSQSSKSWEAKNASLQNQNLNVQEHNKVDVVVIIDNSGSMASEMKAMGTYFNQFLTQLHGLDWQVGIITTDAVVDADVAKKDGRLVEYVGMPGKFVLNSSMDFNAANTAFKNTIQMSTNGSGDERGILTAKRAVQRAFDGKPINAPHVEMFRPDAVLAFVVVSDAYDDISQPEDLINEVKAHWNGQKIFTFHSIVVPENAFTKPQGGSISADDPCKNYRENVKYDGRIYYRLSELTGGIKATECSTDYGSQLTAMGKATVDLVTAATLNCQPVDGNADGVVDVNDIKITLENGNPFTAFKLNGNKLTFNTGLPAGTNSVQYYCF